jgi:hypothetical protein
MRCSACRRALGLWLLLAIVPSPAAAAPRTFVASLSGANESPANASPGTGSVQVTIDDAAHTLEVRAEFGERVGQPASHDLESPVTIAHIHVINGPGDANTADTLGPVATQTPTFPGFPAGVVAGSYEATFDMTLASSYRAGWITDSGGSTGAAESQLFDAIADGRAYFNVHTSFFPSGEIRGFLVPAPEPAAAGPLAVGTIGLLAARRRRCVAGG